MAATIILSVLIFGVASKIVYDLVTKENGCDACATTCAHKIEEKN